MPCIYLHYHLLMILEENKFEEEERKKKFLQMTFEIVYDYILTSLLIQIDYLLHEHQLIYC